LASRSESDPRALPGRSGPLGDPPLPSSNRGRRLFAPSFAGRGVPLRMTARPLPARSMHAAPLHDRRGQGDDTNIRRGLFRLWAALSLYWFCSWARMAILGAVRERQRQKLPFADGGISHARTGIRGSAFDPSKHARSPRHSVFTGPPFRAGSKPFVQNTFCL